MAQAMNTVRYRRVAPNESADGGEDAKKKRRAELVEKIVAKIQAVFWVALSGTIVYLTDLPKTLMENKRINRPYLNASIICLCVNFVIMIYLTAWVPYQERLLSKRFGKPKKLDWEVYCPRMIPTMTAVALLFFFAIIKAMWPVYGLLSPLMVLVLFVGFVFSTHFIPWFS